MSKAIVTAAFALSLLYGTSAMAQQHDDHHQSGGGGGGAPHNTGGGAPHYSAPASGGGAPHNSGQHTQTYTQSYSGGGQYPHRGASQYTGGGAGGQGQGNTHPQLSQYRGQGPGPGGSGGRVRYNAQNYPHILQANRQYHWRGEWNPPPGFYYRHWGYGDRLPYGWFGRAFWILDFDFYGLPPAPYGYAWVREGPDAVLVNVYDGQVVEVEYGVFY